MAVSTIPKNLTSSDIVSKSVSGTTNANGFVRVDSATGWFPTDYIYLSVYAESNDYPNGLYVNEVKIGTAYWARVYDVSTATVLASKSISLKVTALKRPLP